MFRRDPGRPQGMATSRGRRADGRRHEAAAWAAASGSDDPTEQLSPWGGGQRATRPRSPSVQDVATPPARTTRRSTGIGRVIVTAILLVLVVLVIGSVLLYQRVDAFNKAVSTEPTMSSALFGPLGGKARVNVLMIGYSGEAKHGGTYLADSLNILSIDPVTNQTTLIPVPRDLWVAGLPEMPRGGKVNEAFADGWLAGGWKRAGDVEASVVSKVTGLTIDHWISIDFAGLSEMVDAVGGITLVNPRAFQYTWWESAYQAGKWSGSFRKGSLTLNGEQALTYSRVRYTSVTAESSDFARSVRQQAILSALRAKLGDGGLSSLGPGLSLMDALKSHLKTDLSAFDLYLLSGHFHPDRRLELKQDVALSAGRNAAGSYILFPTGERRLGDYAPLKRYIAAELAKPIPTPRPSPTATPAT